MQSIEELADQIIRLLPDEFKSSAFPLAEILTSVKNDNSSIEKAKQQLLQQRLDELLPHLAGQKLEVKNTVISFGTGNQLGDISIQDIVGRDKISITIVVFSGEKNRSEDVIKPPYKNNQRGFFAMFRDPERVWENARREAIRKFTGILFEEGRQQALYKAKILSMLQNEMGDEEELIVYVEYSDAYTFVTNATRDKWRPEGKYKILISQRGNIKNWVMLEKY
jgi:hypothetical protein